ncbi:DMT family transporter [Streptomyces sp. NBC_00536]|uniref:DMT family transporter n=1 Tax=Streptomyces sp. NBC_00536 TaxID=2975769 RepID=UPI002E821DA9|nr:DMT family transporter [Streptomyces sp. NBC_00536]WUC82583.1 DMT family transporter [Streptomyces sp. NBC_00536]
MNTTPHPAPAPSSGDRSLSGDRSRSAVRSLGPGVLGMALVGTSVNVSRTLTDAPLFTAQAVRYAAAALVLLALARAAGARPVWPRGREWLWLAGLAGSGLVVFNIAVVRGVAHAEPAVIAVAVACVPVLLGVIGPVLERQRPSRQVLLAAPVVVAGAVLVQGTGRTDATGVAWATLALACEAGFTLLAVPVLRRHGAWGVSVHSVWLGALMFLVLAVATEPASSLTALDSRQWAAVGYLAALVTAAAFVLWYSTVAAVGAGRAGLLTGVAPLSAAAGGALTGGGVPGAAVWAGLAVVVGGLVLGLRPRRTSAPRTAPAATPDPAPRAVPEANPDSAQWAASGS